MSANKVLDLAEQQGLLDPALVAELRTQIAESKFPVSPDALGQLLVQQGHLTAFQAKKLLASAAAESPAASTPQPPLAAPPSIKPAPSAAPSAPPPQKPKPQAVDELTFADSADAPTKPAPPPAKPTPPPPAAASPKSAATDDLAFADAADAPAAPKPASAPAPKAAPPKTAPTPAAKTPAPPPKPKPAPPTPTPPDAPADLVDVELVADSPAPATKSPPPRTKPAPPAAAPQQPSPKPKPAAPPARPPQPPVDLLAPLPGGPSGGLEPLGGGLEPLGGLEALPGDPFGAPAAAPAADAGKPKAKAPPAKKGPVNPWDSSLLLIGGAALGILLIAFGLLLYTLTRGAAVDIFKVAEEEYSKRSYGSAIQQYEAFLTRVGEQDENAKLAKVKIGIAKIRQFSDGKDLNNALKTAQEQLPVIEQVERFSEVREELASILPDIAEGFANLAKAAEAAQRKEELVKLTDAALALVEHPGYISSGSREQIAPRVANIKDARDVARRSIDQDRDLTAALAKMQSQTESGDIPAAYQTRSELLKIYPGLEEKVAAATAAASAKERQAIKVTDESRPAATEDDAPAPGGKVVLYSLEGKPAAAPAGKLAYVLVDGAVYALDPAAGKLAWRRFVGHETLFAPTPLDGGAAALVIDGRTWQALRLDGQTGKLQWRQGLGEPCHPPLAVEGKIYLATPSGKLHLLDAQTGAVERTAVFPQPLPVAPGYDAKGKLLVQPGAQSTLFYLDAATLACGQSIFFGQRRGSILAPPAVVLEHQLLPESPGDDLTQLRVFVPGESGAAPVEKTRFRLRGRLLGPLAVAGRRVTAFTDRGEVTTFEIDPASKDSIRQVGRIDGAELLTTPQYVLADPGRIWTASNRVAHHEIQPAVQKLATKWGQHENDRFLSAPQLFGELLLHFRRRPGSSAVFAECCQADTGARLWETQLGSPLVLVAADEVRQQLVAINAQGRVFEIPPAAYQAGSYDKAAYVPPPGTGFVNLRRSFPVGEKRWLCVGYGGGAQGLLYDQNLDAARTRLLPLAAGLTGAAAAPVLLGSGLAVPLSAGRIELWEPATGRPLATPFQPPLAAGQKINWSDPLLQPGGTALVIGDGARQVYRLTFKAQPQPFLAPGGAAELPGDVVGGPFPVGESVLAVVRGEAGDELHVLQGTTLAAGAVHKLPARVAGGPYPAGELALVELAGGKLAALGPAGVVWSVDLAHGSLAGPPLVRSGNLVVAFARGRVSLLDPATGAEQAGVEVGEPLGRALAPFGERLLIGGRDGVLHLVPHPK